MPFRSLNLSPEMLKAVADAGYTEPTPIQVAAIPLISAGHDIIGIAQTGTGKTAAFVLPILMKLAASRHNGQRRGTRALVVAPTGSGKTLAFGIPIVQEVDPDLPEVQALVLVPTRELCLQVAGDIDTAGRDAGDNRLEEESRHLIGEDADDSALEEDRERQQVEDQINDAF